MSKEFEWDDRTKAEFVDWTIKVSSDLSLADAFEQFNKLKEQPKRIEVIDFEFDHAKKWVRFYFKDSPFLSGNHYLKLKQAIERVLNNGSHFIDLNKFDIAPMVREAEEKAFNAAREMTGYRFDSYAGGGSMGTNPAVLPEIKQKYPTFNDYKKQNP